MMKRKNLAPCRHLSRQRGQSRKPYFIPPPEVPRCAATSRLCSSLECLFDSFQIERGARSELLVAERQFRRVVFSLGCQLRMITSMQKLFLNVAASLLFVALVILAQAPDGAAQGPAGPDAVATNLVNTVCASCHTLDRVRNKVADKDAWTATVTRMKEKGTGLTDQQVPLSCRVSDQGCWHSPCRGCRWW